MYFDRVESLALDVCQSVSTAGIASGRFISFKVGYPPVFPAPPRTRHSNPGAKQLHITLKYVYVALVRRFMVNQHMSISLKTIAIINYRSCQETMFSLHPELSVLIGKNGSGKTNILNAILLLKKLANVKPWLPQQKERGNQSGLMVEFTCGDRSVSYRALVNYIWHPSNVENVVNAEEHWRFGGNTESSWVSFPLAWAHQTEVEAQFKRERLKIILKHQYAVEGKKGDPYIPSKDELDLMCSIGEFMQRIKYYSASQFTAPSESPSYIELEGDKVTWTPPYAGRGGPHAKFLLDLYKTSTDKPNHYRRFLYLVGKEGIGLVDRIKFHPIHLPASEFEVRTGGKIEQKKLRRDFIVPQFIIDSSTLSPSQLSEGTFRTLALLFYLSTDSNNMLLFEEPEVCVHHGLLGSVMELIKNYAVNKQIVMTTHSDFVLDKVMPENLFLVKKLLRKGTVVTHLPKAMSARNYVALKEYLGNTGNLGEYWRQTNFENG